MGAVILSVLEYSHKFRTHSITAYSHIPLDQAIPYKKGTIKACVDNNYYYAQVEERDNMLEGFPLIVGGWRDKRNVAYGIVATSNYVARKFGIKTGMSANEAQQLCPHVRMFQVDYWKYHEVSKKQVKIFKKYSHAIEPYSMDEVFLDLTGLVSNEKQALEWTMDLKNDIWKELKLTVNVGISLTKCYAKILADMNKPNGHCIAIDDSTIFKKILPLPNNVIMGIGRKRYKKLCGYGISSMAQLAFAPKSLIQNIFGQNIGENLWMQARGEADAIIAEGKERPIKYSATYMHTFPTYTLDKEELWGETARSIEQICYRLRAHGKKASRFHLFFRPQNDKGFGMDFKINRTSYEGDVYPHYKVIFDQLYLRSFRFGIDIRGIGTYADGLKDENVDQFSIFETDKKPVELYHAIDKIRDMGSFHLIQSASSMKYVRGRTHFFDRSD